MEVSRRTFLATINGDLIALPSQMTLVKLIQTRKWEDIQEYMENKENLVWEESQLLLIAIQNFAPIEIIQLLLKRGCRVNEFATFVSHFQSYVLLNKF